MVGAGNTPALLLDNLLNRNHTNFKGLLWLVKEIKNG